MRSRVKMEAHLVEGVEIPWDEIFGPAEKAGKMSPPAETRADEGEEVDGADDEDPGEFFDRKAEETKRESQARGRPQASELNSPTVRELTKQAAKPAAESQKAGESTSFKVDMSQFRKAAFKAAAGEPFEMPEGSVVETSGATHAAATDYEEAGLVDGPVVIALESPIWAAAKKGGTIPFPEVKGREVHLDAPEGTADEVVEKLRRLLLKLGATAVAEIVPCEYCGAQMVTIDAECPKCGAQVDDDGTLLSRPCLRFPPCKGQVPAVGAGASSICGSCGTIHTMDAERGWVVSEPEKPKEAPAPRRGRRAAAPPFARSSGG
jgi:hypothetical protein